MPTILVTWWSGFVWSHLCQRLIDRGDTVTCLDNLSTSSRTNIASLLDHPLFSFVEHDVQEPFFSQVDQIYHLACPASPLHYQKDPLATIKTSLLWTMHMLDLAVQTQAKILFSSTSEVYGDPLIHPQPESYRGNVHTTWPRSCYDEGKRAAETLMMDYHRIHGVAIRIIRIFNTYGPHMHPQDGRVVSNFIMQALTHQDITLYGDGSQTRSFQYVDDLISGMLCMMDNTHGFIGPVNIWTSFEFSMHSLAQKILKLIPESTSKIIMLPLPIDDPKQRKADGTLAKKELNREPKITLDEGLQRTIPYFKSVIENNQWTYLS